MQPGMVEISESMSPAEDPQPRDTVLYTSSPLF
jgi:hypothetical protein